MAAGPGGPEGAVAATLSESRDHRGLPKTIIVEMRTCAGKVNIPWPLRIVVVDLLDSIRCRKKYFREMLWLHSLDPFSRTPWCLALRGHGSGKRSTVSHHFKDTDAL